jgi:hypothetical protein
MNGFGRMGVKQVVHRDIPDTLIRRRVSDLLSIPVIPVFPV